MGRFKLSSPGVLLILAVLATAGIFLMDFFYLAPHMQQLQVDALHEQAGQVNNAALKAIAKEHQRLASACQDAADPCAGTDAEFLSRLRTLVNVHQVWLTDADGRVLDAAIPIDNVDDLTDPAAFQQAIKSGVSLPDLPPGGLMQLGGTIVMFSHRRLYDGDKALWLITPLDTALPDNVSVVTGRDLPTSVLGPGHGRQALWWAEQDKALAVAWPAVDATNRALGYFQATIPVRQIHRQAVSSRRMVLIVLSLSIGLAALIIVGMHILIAGPVYRLLERLRDLPFGKNAPKDLTRDLHGEPLALARSLESAFDHLAEMSRTDELTNLANRRHFEQVLTAFFAQAERYNRPLSLIALDVDFFKAVNDTGGHQAGDELLGLLADAIRGVCRKSDLPARLGGDEFSILLPETTSQAAEVVAKRLQKAISAKEFQVDKLELHVTLSIGIVDLNVVGAESPASMQELADHALYLAKERGRNCVVQADELIGSATADHPIDHGASQLTKKLAGLNSQFQGLFLDAMATIVEALESRNPFMADHTRRVQRYAAILAKEMGLSEPQVQRIEVAGMLHDVGMLVLPDSILSSPVELDDQQRRLLHQHPLVSVRIMEGMGFLEQEIPAVRYHHERFDGSGYPEGLAGAAIPLPGRVLTVADTFDALTSLRPRRQAMSQADALMTLEQGAGSHFDPAVVNAFVALVRRYGEAFIDVAMSEITPPQPIQA